MLLTGSGARATPATPGFGPMIDSPAAYQGQSKCSPEAKPGVLAFQAVIMRAYPYTGYGSISRDCGIGGQSEHKEGRAWDWGVRVSVERERAAAEEVIDWLASTDKRGNRRALARRFGIMYLIWNRRIWFPQAGWRTYCVMRKGVCYDPEDGGMRHPHTDHVHFSFSWKGARKKTTYWHKDRSNVTGISTHPSSAGYWLSGANGGVRRSGASEYMGSPQDSYPRKPVVAVATTPTGDGYWLVSGKGKVYSYGDARGRGGTQDRRVRIVGIASTSSGRGYWLVTASGRVFDFGNAAHFGDARGEGRDVVGVASTPTDDGYWLFAADGTVLAYGDAEHFGDASSKGVTSIVGGDSLEGTGYWLVTRGGRVFAYGAAARHGDARGTVFKGHVVGLSATPTGAGYYLATSMGDVLGFGDAPSSSQHRGTYEVDHAITAREQAMIRSF